MPRRGELGRPAVESDRQPQGERQVDDQPHEARRQQTANRSPDARGLMRREQRRRGQHVAKKPVVDRVAEHHERAEHAGAEQHPRASPSRQHQHAHGRRHDGAGRGQPVRDSGRLEQRLAEEHQLFRKQRGRRPPDVGAAREGEESGGQRASSAPTEKHRASYRQHERYRREKGGRGGHDDHELARRMGRHLREPGHAFLDHVPLQPVEARNARRQHAPCDADARGWKHDASQVGADALVIGQGPRPQRQLTRNEPQPVIGQMHARRIPGALARIGERQRDRDFLNRLEHARRASVDDKRSRVRWTRQAPTAGSKKGEEEEEEN